MSYCIESPDCSGSLGDLLACSPLQRYNADKRNWRLHEARLGSRELILFMVDYNSVLYNQLMISRAYRGIRRQL